ncbi:MAG: hypothetical protein ACRDNF_04540 [Streptosporangiaceae bacterium]
MSVETCMYWDTCTSPRSSCPARMAHLAVPLTRSLEVADVFRRGWGAAGSGARRPVQGDAVDALDVQADDQAMGLDELGGDLFFVERAVVAGVQFEQLAGGRVAWLGGDIGEADRAFADCELPEVGAGDVQGRAGRIRRTGGPGGSWPPRPGANWGAASPSG